MMVTIDRAGRVVIPKDVRARLDLGPGTSIELIVQGDALVLRPVRPAGRKVIEVDGWPVIEPGERTITDADVQHWRDADRR